MVGNTPSRANLPAFARKHHETCPNLANRWRRRGWVPLRLRLQGGGVGGLVAEMAQTGFP